MNQGKYIFAQLTDVSGNYKCTKSVNKKVRISAKLISDFQNKYKKNSMIKKWFSGYPFEKIFQRV